MTRKRTLRLAAVNVSVVCVAALATACTGSGGDRPSSGDKPDTLRWGMVTDNLASIDPVTLTAGNALVATIYDPLIGADEDGQLAPAIAESWDTPDALTYVFNLRQDVQFWDGTEMTSEDVVASLDYIRLPPSQYESLFVTVESIKARDASTVVMKMKQPDASILSLLSSVAGSIFKKEFLDENKKDFGKPGTLTMATGPYEITSLNPTGGAEFTANPNWWGGEPAIKNVTVTPFKTITSAALAYRSGEIDAVFPLADPKAFVSSANAELTSVPGCKQTFMSLNTQVAPWNDVHVRRAFAHAVNRSELAGAEGDGSVPYDSIFPPMVLSSIADESEIDALMESIPKNEFDLEAAEAELAESDYPDGAQGTFEVPDDGFRPKIAQAIASMVAEVGIDLEVKVLSEDQYTQRIGVGDPEEKIGLTIQRLDCSSEPNSTAGFLLDSSQAAVPYSNYAAFENPAADEFVQDGISTTDNAERFEAYAGLAELVAEEVPYLPLYLGENVVALSDEFIWPSLNPFSSVYGSGAWVAQVEPS